MNIKHLSTILPTLTLCLGAFAQTGECDNEPHLSGSKSLLIVGESRKETEERILTCMKPISLKDLPSCKNVENLRDLGNNQYLIRFKSKPGKTCLDQLKLKCQIQENLEYRAFPELKR